MKIRAEYTDTVSPAIARAIASLTDRRELNAAVARAAKTEVQRNIQERLALRPNKLGAPSTGYWLDVFKGVSATADGTAATVAIPGRGVRLHYFGGTVRPTTKRALTIPISALSHGKMVGDFPAGSIFKFTSKKGNQVLAIKVGEGKDARVEPLFVLRKSATLKPDRTVLPPKTELGRAAVRAARGYVKRKGLGQ